MDNLEYTIKENSINVNLSGHVDSGNAPELEAKLLSLCSEKIFDMTGFTQMLDVRKAFKTISVKGCEVIGSGANGKVYRIDNETIVKTFMDANALQDIERERQLARTAFVLGVPTAISYDVVKIEGGGYGSVYELLKATNFASMLVKKEKSIDELAKMSVELLKTIHPGLYQINRFATISYQSEGPLRPGTLCSSGGNHRGSYGYLPECRTPA